MIRHNVALAAMLGATAFANVAAAQTKSAVQVGREVAAKRGVVNQDCYARVFARHAVVVEYTNGARGWNAASTPAYNADMRRSCGVDRLALLRDGRPARQPAQRVVRNLQTGESYRVVRTAAAQRQARVVLRQSALPMGQDQVSSQYRGGYALASKERLNNPACFAKVYARHAVPVADPNGRLNAGWSGIWSNNPSFSRELWSECRIAR